MAVIFVKKPCAQLLKSENLPPTTTPAAAAMQGARKVRDETCRPLDVLSYLRSRTIYDTTGVQDEPEGIMFNFVLL